MEKFLDKKGYTLIEIIISVSIFSVALVMIIGFYINFTRFHNNIEINSLINTNIINTLNYIKYSVDETISLEIVPKDFIENNKNKGLDYKYIMLDDGKIVSGRLDNTSSSIILDKEQINEDFILNFKKDDKYPSNLIIKLEISSMGNPFTSYVNIQNMQYNNLSIKGDNNVAIIYKNE